MRQLILSWIRAKKSLHSEYFFLVTFVLERWHVNFSIILLVVQVHDTSSRQKMPTRWREIRIGIQPSDLIFINQIGQIGRVGGAHPFRPPCRRVEALTQVRTAVRRAPHVFFPQLWVCPDRGECRVGVEGPRTLPCCSFFFFLLLRNWGRSVSRLVPLFGQSSRAGLDGSEDAVGLSWSGCCASEMQS